MLRCSHGRKSRQERRNKKQEKQKAQKEGYAGIPQHPPPEPPQQTKQKKQGKPVIDVGKPPAADKKGTAASGQQRSSKIDISEFADSLGPTEIFHGNLNKPIIAEAKPPTAGTDKKGTAASGRQSSGGGVYGSSMADLLQLRNSVGPSEQNKQNEPVIMAEEQSSKQEKQIAELKAELSALRAMLKKERGKNEAERSSEPANEHFNPLLEGLKAREILTDIERLKALINLEQLKMTDTNSQGLTLLLMSSSMGSYEIVKMCLNLGADIHHKDNDGLTALDHARKHAMYHIEQMLLFELLPGNFGQRIEDIADTMNRQEGITQNMLQAMSHWDKSRQALFKDSLLEIMNSVLSQKQCFSDDLLSLCVAIECERAPKKSILDTNLWQKVIRPTCDDVFKHGNNKDWFWFKECLLRSSIWYIETNQAGQEQEQGKEQEQEKKEQEKSSCAYLYNELLKLTVSRSEQNLTELDSKVRPLAGQNQSDWEKLIQWGQSKQASVRQDSVTKGIRPKFNKDELTKKGSASSSFDIHRFYDYNQYLSELMLMAQMVDNEFQQSVQLIFNVDEWSKRGHIPGGSGDGTLEYQRGPVKLIERARSKAQNDYIEEAYPSSACVVDLNRCSLVFNDISTLLAALKLLENKINNYQSGNIVKIVRAKNGWKEYVKKPQYADIKLNVLIEGKGNNIVGEVQFLLSTMKEFKNKAHNLYSVEREQEFVKQSVSSILPKLVDHKKQLFVAGNMGDVKALCRLMVFSNFSEQQLVQVDPVSKETICINTMVLNRFKSLKFLHSIVPHKLLVDTLFLDCRSTMNCIDELMCSAHQIDLALIQYVLGMEDVMERIQANDDHLFRVVYFLMAQSIARPALLDFVLKQKCGIDAAKMVEMLNYVSASKVYRDFSVLNRICWTQNVAHMRYLVDWIGRKAFLGVILKSAQTLLISVKRRDLEMLRFLLSIKGVKQALLADRGGLTVAVMLAELQLIYEEHTQFAQFLLRALFATSQAFNEYSQTQPELEQESLSFFDDKFQ